MNYLWSAFILISIAIGIITGRISETSTALVDGAKTAVETLIEILGVMCFWTGMMEIGERAGLLEKLSKFFKPIIKFLFPEVKGEKAKNAILMNITANLLGIGNAATPFGLKAMEEMNKENFNKGTATNSMARFVLLNTASIQLVPTTIYALRIASGSKDAFTVTLPIWISSVLALTVGLIITKICEKERFFKWR